MLSRKRVNKVGGVEVKSEAHIDANHQGVRGGGGSHQIKGYWDQCGVMIDISSVQKQ